MLTHADACSRMQVVTEHVRVGWERGAVEVAALKVEAVAALLGSADLVELLTYADVCRHMLTYADAC